MSDVRLDKKIALYINDRKITKHIYDWGKFCNNTALARKGPDVDVYDTLTGKRKFTIPCVSSVDFGHNSIIVTGTNGLMGVYDLNGKVILPVIYRKVYNKGEYYIVKDTNDYFTLLKYENERLQVVISSEKKFEELRICRDGVITYKRACGEKVCGVHSYAGEEVVPAIYKSITFRPDSILVETSKGLRGIYSYSGKQIVPAEYSSIKKYSNCYVVTVWKNDSWYHGLYSEEGKQILKPRYDYYEVTMPFIHFHKGQLESLYSLLNGRRILPLKYLKIKNYYNVVYAVEGFNSYSIHSFETGEKLLDKKYDYIRPYLPFILLLKKEEKSYYYLVKRNLVFDSEKYQIRFDEKANIVYVRESHGNCITGNWIPYPNNV